MVLGLFEGEIEIKTDKLDYLPGETIQGQVILNLKQPKKAKELRIMFYGELQHRERRVSYGPNGKRHVDREEYKERLFEQSVILDGEKEYPQGISTYPFKITLPRFRFTQKETRKISLGPITLDLSSLHPIKRVRWYLDASLNIPMSFDINKKIRINLQV